MKNGLSIVTGLMIEQEATLEQFIGLDVSMKDTFIKAHRRDSAQNQNDGEREGFAPRTLSLISKGPELL